jgi:hypothetical protein
MADAVQATSSIKRSGLVARLWRGDVSLPICYWVFGTGAGIVISLLSLLITYCLGFYARSLSRFDLGFISWTWVIVTYGYCIFISIATWRSASNYSIRYPRRRIWSILAKIMMCVSALILIKGGISFITHTDESDIQAIIHPTTPEQRLSAAAMISGLNAHLPKKIDSATTLNNITLEGDTFVYYYVLSQTVKDPDVFKKNVKAILIEKVCTVPAVVGNLVAGIDYKYNYTDSNNITVSIAITKSDCHNLI